MLRHQKKWPPAVIFNQIWKTGLRFLILFLPHGNNPTLLSLSLARIRIINAHQRRKEYSKKVINIRRFDTFSKVLYEGSFFSMARRRRRLRWCGGRSDWFRTNFYINDLDDWQNKFARFFSLSLTHSFLRLNIVTIMYISKCTRYCRHLKCVKIFLLFFFFNC